MQATDQIVNSTRLFPMQFLKEHEKINPSNFYKLRSELIRDGFQKDPIIIENKHNIILDGHHRVNILKSLGYSKIATHTINYLNNAEIRLRTWHPLIIYSLIDPLHLFGKYCSETKIDKIKEIHSKLHLKEGSIILNLDREKAIHMIEGRAKLAYVDSEELAVKMVKKGSAVAALSFNSISKEEVINCALSGKKFPPKTTRHIIPNRPRNWCVPFERLK